VSLARYVKVRAPFRYWGSKVRMAPWIVERLPQHDHFVEACAGSAAIMAVKAPTIAETLNDTYGEVVNFFRVLRSDRSPELIDLVAFTPYSHEEFLAAGDLMETGCEDDVQRAWAFFVRMQMAVVPGRTGWSYGVRGASAAKANKPGRWSTMPALLQAAAARFARVQITDWDVLDLIDRLDVPGVLFFVDPPYIEASRPRSTGASSGYAHDEFNHEGFIAGMHGTRYASFAITHYPHPLYDDSGLGVAGDFESHRNIPNGSGRDRQLERLYVLDRTRDANLVLPL
jgi:DNA adenine methylase